MSTEVELGSLSYLYPPLLFYKVVLKEMGEIH